jgi:2'-5' RNA ligase
VRLFFALWPDQTLRARIAEAAIALRLDRSARPVQAENYHLTLAFVGEVAASQLSALQQAAQRQRTVACDIRLDAYDFWPDAQVAVAVARQPPSALTALAAQLHRELGLPHPPSYRMHVTLARKVTQAPVPQAMSPLDWRVRSFSLIRSDRDAARSVYTVVDTWPLLDKAQKP